MTKPKKRVVHVMVDPDMYKRLLALLDNDVRESSMSQIVRWVLDRGLETIESKG